ncbi:MAG: trypsin-like peptidase domain-containing protein [Eubacterium sp.]|nr:trypsin-like peptidase domain-containing protein [Eubacterium sp.]
MMKPKKAKDAGNKIIATALCCSLLGGMVGAGGYATFSKMFSGGGDAVGAINSAVSTLQAKCENSKKVGSTSDLAGSNDEKNASQIYDDNVNSTVGITTEIPMEYMGYQTTSASAGSGFIYSEDGYIVTNYHVVKGADKIKVTTYDKNEYDAGLIGYDDTNDIAVLKIDAKGLKPVTIGDSDKLSVGDSVVAIGNPLGELTFSLTSGNVSALDRQVKIQNNSMKLIQTDCAINSGNSGGALFNSSGEVIGITNAKSSGGFTQASVDNIGFAIPINSVNGIIDSIIEKGYIMKPYIGITGSDLASDYQMGGLFGNNQTSDTAGVVINNVEEGSPAATSGLKPGDIITKVNDEEISGMVELRSLIQNTAEGDSIKFSLSRDGENVDVDVTPVMHKQDAKP